MTIILSNVNRFKYNQIKKRFIAESVSEKSLKSVNIWQSYKQGRDCSVLRLLAFLIWLLATPPHLKYLATLPCNLSLMACFAEVKV